jgi:DNA recombination protein RmuC
MEIFLIFLALVIIVFLAAIAKRLWKPPVVEEKKDDQAFLLIQNQIQDQQKQIQHQMGELAKTLDARLGDSTKTMLSQSDRNAKIIGDITERLTKLDETNRQVVGFADQLKNLQDILKNPKQRGVLGEYFLETVLKNVLPPGTYQLQYPFKDGKDIVDAVIFYQEKIIPIDSKFSLENYNRLAGATTDDERKRYETALHNDLKTRVDETSKYIKPAENTVDFAFMFIPSEALYYDLLINKVGVAAERDLVQYAAEKHVYPVSPTTFYAYLQMALQGMRQMEINRSAETIRKNVGELQKHLARYEEYLEKIGSHLTTTTNAYNTAYKEFGKIDKDILKIGNIEAESESDKLL